jgi:hypothetical protein
MELRCAGDFPSIGECVIGNDDGHPGRFRRADMCMPYYVADFPRAEVR